MFLSDLSIKRPVFATVLMLALVTLGVFSYRRLAIDMFPDIEIPVLSIITQYPGASPETVEREVTKKLEQAVNPISGVKHVYSTSREGLSTVIVEFNLEVKINAAAQDARSKISAIRNDLPAGIQEPVIQKLDIGGMAIVSLAVRSPEMTSRELTTLVDRKVKRRIENLPGVGKVDLVGESKREVAVDLDPSLQEYQEKIAARIEAVRSSRSSSSIRDRYYIHKTRPFFVGGRIYYEVTFYRAVDKVNKFDRIIAFSYIDMTDKYAAMLTLQRDSIEVLGQTMPITVSGNVKMTHFGNRKLTHSS